LSPQVTCEDHWTSPQHATVVARDCPSLFCRG
jgi:hypothetical protein